MAVHQLDLRMAYGASCAWWGSIKEVGNRGGLPCCPHCSGVLFEMANMSEWWAGVDRYAADHPGYREFVEWTKGKHFASFRVAAVAYSAETGKQSGLAL